MIIRVLGAIAVLAAGVLTAVLDRAGPGYAFLGPSPAAIAATVAVGWALAGAGLLAADRRLGWLLAGAGLAWFVTDWNTPLAGDPVVFTAGLVLGPAVPAVVAAAVLPPSRVSRVVVTVAVIDVVILLGAGPAMLADPARAGCAQCPRDLVAVAAQPAVAAALARAGRWAGVAWAVAAVAVLLIALLRSSPARRRGTAPIVVPGLVYLTFVVGSGHGGQAAALAALAAGVVLIRVQSRLIRRSIARLVVDLARSPAPGGLTDRLAETLGDPSVQLGYPLPDGTVVDGHGQPLALAAGAGTPLVLGGRILARLVHRPGRLDDPAVRQEIARTARLALEHERLTADLAHQLAELRASRLRVVAAGERERRRLERDLHDGAQQRLITLILALPADTHRPAVDELVLAAADLRALAHGIFPAELAEGGLGAAIESLAEDAAIPVRLGPIAADRLDPAVESAGYLVVATALRHLSSATVGTVVAGGRLHVRVTGPAAGEADLADVPDRIGALDGRLVVDRPADGTLSVWADLPCAS